MGEPPANRYLKLKWEMRRRQRENFDFHRAPSTVLRLSHYILTSFSTKAGHSETVFVHLRNVTI